MTFAGGLLDGSSLASIAQRVPEPEPRRVREAREHAGLSQTQAAALVSPASRAGYKTWASYESDTDNPNHRRIPLALWELFLLLTDQHPRWRLAERKGSRTTEAE